MNQWNGYQAPQSWQNKQADIIETTTTTTPITTTIPSWQQARPMNQWNGYQAPQSWQSTFIFFIHIVHV